METIYGGRELQNTAFLHAVATVWHKLYEVYLMSCATNVKNEKIKQNKMKKKSEFDQLIKRQEVEHADLNTQGVAVLPKG